MAKHLTAENLKLRSIQGLRGEGTFLDFDPNRRARAVLEQYYNLAKTIFCPSCYEVGDLRSQEINPDAPRKDTAVFNVKLLPNARPIAGGCPNQIIQEAFSSFGGVGSMPVLDEVCPGWDISTTLFYYDRRQAFSIHLPEPGAYRFMKGPRDTDMGPAEWLGRFFRSTCPYLRSLAPK